MKSLLVLLVFLFFCNEAAGANICANVSGYPSLAASVAALGETKTCLAYSDRLILEADVTVPSNITLIREGSGLISGAHRLTIQGPFVSDPVQAWERDVIISFAGNTSIGPILPQWWGALGDGATDSFDAIQAATLATSTIGGTLYFSPTSLGYRISGGLVFAKNIDAEMNNSFLLYTGSANEAALTIGAPGLGNITYKRTYKGLRIKRQTISDWSSEGSIGIRVYNAADSFIEIRQAEGFTIGVQALAEGQSFAYNQIWLDLILNNKVGLDLRSQAPGNSSPNQNIFYGGRFTEFSNVNPGKS